MFATRAARGARPEPFPGTDSARAITTAIPDRDSCAKEDRGDGILIPLHDRSSATPHPHEYLLTEERVRDVLDGEFVRVSTPRNLGHDHTVIYNGRGQAGTR